MDPLRKHIPYLARLTAVALVLGMLQSPAWAATNEIYDDIVTDGITLGAQENTKLASPALKDGLDAAGQRKAIESLLADKYEWTEFTRKSVFSPFLLKIDDEGTKSGKIGRKVDLYFVAYTSLNALRGDDFFQKQLDFAASDQGETAGRVKVLSHEDLEKRGLVSGGNVDDPHWVAVTLTVLNKVRISLTTKNIRSQTNDSILVASIADPRFVNDAEYPNCWSSIIVDDAGRRQNGPPQTYDGLGSYVKATQLADPAGAIFVEYHVAFAEPEGWFHGANLLRSKLPIVAQDMVRKFRRSLAER